jgi:hypothetical protein
VLEFQEILTAGLKFFYIHIFGKKMLEW